MTTIQTTRSINASVERVFRTVADMSQFSQALPHIVNVEFLSEQQVGLGTRFRETRLMNGKPVDTELEVTEYIEDNRIRLIADSHGTVWDTLFTVAPRDTGTELTMVMEARAYKLMSRIMNPLIKCMVAKAVANDMDAVKTYCEQATQE